METEQFKPCEVCQFCNGEFGCYDCEDCQKCAAATNEQLKDMARIGATPLLEQLSHRLSVTEAVNREYLDTIRHLEREIQSLCAPENQPATIKVGLLAYMLDDARRNLKDASAILGHSETVEIRHLMHESHRIITDVKFELERLGNPKPLQSSAT